MFLCWKAELHGVYYDGLEGQGGAMKEGRSVNRGWRAGKMKVIGEGEGFRKDAGEY